MKQSLQLKLGQQLVMTPQLQQAIKLLQLSTLDLQQEIQEALETNPMLEVLEAGDGSEGDGIEGGEGTESLEGLDSAAGSEGLDGAGSDQQLDSVTASAGDSATASEGEHGDGLNGSDVDLLGTEPAETDSAGLSEAIPNDLPVDSQWEDVYQAPVASSLPASNDNDIDFESRNASGETLADHLLW